MNKIRYILVFIFLIIIIALGHKTSLICNGGCLNNDRINVFGKVSQETAIEYCENKRNSNHSDRFVATLYRGDGGATTAFWYSIAVKFEDEREVQVYWTYSAPEITNLDCNKDGITFHSDKVEKFTINQIRELINRPIGHYKSERSVR